MLDFVEKSSNLIYFPNTKKGWRWRATVNFRGDSLSGDLSWQICVFRYHTALSRPNWLFNQIPFERGSVLLPIQKGQGTCWGRLLSCLVKTLTLLTVSSLPSQLPKSPSGWRKRRRPGSWGSSSWRSAAGSWRSSGSRRRNGDLPWRKDKSRNRRRTKYVC